MKKKKCKELSWLELYRFCVAKRVAKGYMCTQNSCYLILVNSTYVKVRFYRKGIQWKKLWIIHYTTQPINNNKMDGNRYQI